jgi:hypothetical protein
METKKPTTELTNTTPSGNLYELPVKVAAPLTIQKVNGTSLKQIPDCFDRDYLSIRVMSEGAMFELEAFITEQLLDLNEFLNLSEKMSLKQIQMTGKLLVAEFQNLNVADIKMCIQMGMAGKFGKLFNRLDGQIVLEWFRTYQDERLEIAESTTSEVHQVHKKQFEEDFMAIDPKVLERVKETLKSKINFDSPVKEPVDMGDFKNRLRNADAEFLELPEGEQTPENKREIYRKYNVL